MAVDIRAAVAVEKSTTGVDVLAENHDALAGSPVRLKDVIVVLLSVRLEIAQLKRLAEQVKSYGPLRVSIFGFGLVHTSAQRIIS